MSANVDVLDVPDGVPTAPPRFSAIYITGPMTGLPDFNYPAFHEAAKRWRDAGWHVENPAESYDLSDPATAHIPYEGFLRSALQQIVCGCEAMALLPGWRGSTGAKYEVMIASALGMSFFNADTMRRIKPPTIIMTVRY